MKTTAHQKMGVSLSTRIFMNSFAIGAITGKSQAKNAAKRMTLVGLAEIWFLSCARGHKMADKIASC